MFSGQLLEYSFYYKILLILGISKHLEFRSKSQRKSELLNSGSLLFRENKCKALKRTTKDALGKSADLQEDCNENLQHVLEETVYSVFGGK